MTLTIKEYGELVGTDREVRQDTKYKRCGIA